MKRRTLIIGIVIVLAALGSMWYFKIKKKDNPVVLVTETPKFGPISSSVMATGTIQPVDTVAVGTQVSGTIAKVLVDFNSVVKKGALLAQLDQSLFLAQVQQITANLQLAQNNLAYQKQNFNRQSQLYQAGAISQADFETAENAYKTAGDNVQSVSAQLKSAEKNLSFSSIYSPINGTVLSRNISEGQTVAASFNTPTLFSIAKDLTKMQVRASVDEADIGNIRKGERVTFTVDAFPNDTFTGTVQEIRLQPVISANVVTYTTIINAPNNDLKLKPGMTANITIYTQEKSHVMLISSSAVHFNPDPSLASQYVIYSADTSRHLHALQAAEPKSPPGIKDSVNSSNVRKKDSASRYTSAFVWLKIGDTLQQKRILTGLDDDIHVEVIHGLKPQDLIVTAAETTAQAKGASSTENSPFMPRRPRQQPSKGTAGGSTRRSP